MLRRSSHYRGEMIAMNERADFESIICEAIRERRLLVVDYAGARRVVQPHVYGDDHAGDRLLSAYQVSGGSASGEERGWKSFRMDRLTDVVVAAETFDRARPEFQHDDGAYARILCQTDDD
jgi:predicted DNA-binding transcriptional regulator YafY